MIIFNPNSRKGQIMIKSRQWLPGATERMPLPCRETLRGNFGSDRNVTYHDYIGGYMIVYIYHNIKLYN